MKRRTAVLSVLLAACAPPISVVVAPDAPVVLDAPPTPYLHCEVAGTAWTPLDSPLSVRETTVVGPAAIHEGTVAMGQRDGRVAITDGTSWRPLGATSDTLRPIDAIGYALDTWWVGQGGEIYRWSGTEWVAAGLIPPAPDSIETYATFAIFSVGATVLVWSSSGVFVAEPSLDAWTLALEQRFPLDVVATDRFVYALFNDPETFERQLMRTADGVTWEAVDGDVPASSDDLVAAGSTLLVNVQRGGLGGYARLDEDALDRLQWVEQLASDPRVTWLGEDGTALAHGPEGRLWRAPDLTSTWEALPETLQPFAISAGISTSWAIVSEGATIVFVPQPVGVAARVLRSDDRAATFHDLTTATSSAPIADMASDHAALIVRVRDADGRTLSFRAEDGAWAPIEVPGDGVPASSVTDPRVPNFDHLAGLDGAFVGLPGDGALHAPYLSTDGGRTFAPLDVAYPEYSSTAGAMTRHATACARDAEGFLHIGTVGGFVQIPGASTGELPPSGYRPGSGVLRWDGIGWDSDNAGIPIEAPADSLGGAGPYRSDVTSMASTSEGLLVALVGHGVYAQRDGRWQPWGTGLSIDAEPTLLRVGDSAVAYDASGSWALDGELWLPRGAGYVTADALGDLWVHANASAVSASHDRDETTEALPPLADVVDLDVTREHLYARTSAHAIFSLPITCAEVTR